MNRREALAAAGILLAALGIRLLCQHELRDYVLYRVPLVDAQEYVEWGARLAQGGEEPRDAYYKAPFYPHLLGVAMRWLGPQVSAAYRLNLLLGLCNVLLLGGWVRRVAGARLGWIAMAFAAVYGPFLYYEAQAMPTILAITLALVSLLALSSGTSEPRPRRLAIAGLATGLLVLTRPSFLIWLAVQALWLLRGGARRHGGRALLLVGVALATVAPVTWRNHARSGSWVLVSANSGINFFLGNNAEAHRTATLRPGLQWEELVSEPPEMARRGQAHWDAFFAARGRDWVRQHPLDFLRGLFEKCVLYLNAHEIDRNLDVRGFRAHSLVLRLAPHYNWIAPWILLGLVVGWKRGGLLRLAALFWIANALATVLFFVTERYRLDAAPAAILLGLLAVAEIAALLQRRAAALPRAAAMALLGAGALLAFGDFYGVRSLYPAHAASLEGVALYKEGRYSAAIDRLREALREDPGDADAHYQLGTALHKQNRWPEALREYETAHRAAPRNIKPLVNAAWILRQMGNRDRALEYSSQAAALEPHDAGLRFEVALLLDELGRHGEARRAYEAVLDATDDPALQGAARAGIARADSAAGVSSPPPRNLRTLGGDVHRDPG